MPDVHNRTRYLAGCRCDACRKAQSDYRKDLRHRNRRSKQRNVAALSSVPSVVEPQVGQVEAGVMAEIAGLSAVDSRAGLVQVALALARVLDDRVAIAQHPSAAHRLSETLDKLRRGADAKKGRLASVRQLAKPGAATG